ncbi:YihY/virulence factor BrkB family protein [Nocardioides limicola]|uniref:YihY/virulence factor BrkB family protein n=1 Tax=Nocardioides limicola TaxID=2803368 RepID=UPI0027DE39E1|nr:YhjD/YihY/BrkB family envelope integrity protein [Nocardioides sp. DJM-14]
MTKLDDLRARSRFLDHVLRMVSHYGLVKGTLQAGAVTYFAFLSFFPLIALGFFVVGQVSRIYPEARDDLVAAIDGVLPGIIGEGPGQLSLTAIEANAGAIGLIGLAGVLYAGLGWLSGMRQALVTVFVLPADDHPNFVVGKLRDLLSLAVIGVVMVVSVSIAGAVTGFSQQLLELVGLDGGLSWLLRLLAVVLGLAANTVLFYALFRLLTKAPLPSAALWKGALVGAIGFEALKHLSTFLLAATKGQPAFQAFGIALILLVWINYFSRVVMYAAAWAYTAPAAEAVRRAEVEAVQQADAAAATEAAQAIAADLAADRPGRAKGLAATFLTGAGAGIALAVALRRRGGA